MGRRARKPLKLPVLRPCPTCLLSIEEGAGPNGLAHHECRAPVEDDLSLEGVRRRLHRAILERASTASAKELAELYRSLGEVQKPGRGESGHQSSDDLLRWLNREAAARKAG
jgi:hypothetical protein